MSYKDQNSTLTLRQGLDLFHSTLQQPVTGDLTPRAEELFRCHDICHVVFGLGSSLIEETLADTVTLLGSDVGFRAYLAYIKEPAATELLEDISKKELLIALWKSGPHIYRIWRMCKHMNKKWPFYNAGDYLDTPLCELRTTYGIQVLDVSQV